MSQNEQQRKRCSSCREVKSIDEFYRRFQNGKWQYRSHCKVCLIAKARHRTANRSTGSKKPNP